MMIKNEAVRLTHIVPFPVEDELKRIGGLYEKAADWESFAVVDGRVVTGPKSRFIDGRSPSALEATLAKSGLG